MANAQFGAPISLEGIQGPQGLQGARGFSVLAGSGMPAPDLGQVGDIYVDLDSALLYAPKTTSGWPSATRSLIGKVGPQGELGPRGAALLNDYGPPEDSVGVDGDSYFNTQNGGIYGPKAGGHWPTSFTSLIGPSGSQGAVGTMILAANGAPNDAQGVDGDFFVDTLDGRLYGPKADGMWGNGISLIGPMGSTGAQGVRGLAGADGATIIRGTGAPSDEGKPGDFYFDSDASKFYGPRTSAVQSPWPPQGFSVRGDVGPIGPQGPGGMMGADGKTLRSGAGDPADTLGDDGDFYFNAATGYLVGPKANGTWPLPGFLLKGPAGDRGPVGQTGSQGIQGPGILAGSGAPSDSFGTQGSFYIDGQNYVLYGPKDENAQNPWSLFRNIVGPQGVKGADSTVPGPQGIAGPRGLSVQSGQGAPANTLGNDGDLYVDLSGPFLYNAKQNGAWPTTYQSLAGAQGPVGPTSTTPGPAGARGASLLTGSGAPSAAYGSDGDVYLDIDAGALYGAKANGMWPTQSRSLIGAAGATGAAGAPGAAGKDGTVLRYGSGMPTGSTVANNGDFYLDQTASRLYGPRAGGSFPTSSVSLIGPTGANGALIITGNGPPSSGVGSLGDIYIDLTAGNLYGTKTNSGWPTAYTSLVGAMGAQGVAGATIQTGQGAPSNTLGNVGDIYVDLQGGNLFGAKTASGWPTTSKSLIGPQGVAGQTGASGAPGFSVQSGSGAPANTLGNVGDLYLDTAAGNLYGAKTASGWPSSFKSLVGPTGATGATGAAGSNATVPNDITGNSLMLAPVSGDANPVQLQVKNGSGQVFLADAAGNVTAAGNLSVAGTSSLGAVTASSLSATGAVSSGGSATAQRFVAASPGSASSPMLQYTANNSGTNYTTGIYSEATYAQLYETVAGYISRSTTYLNTNPRDNGVNYVTHTFASGTGSTQPSFRVFTGNGLAFQITGNSAASFAAALGVGGLTTTAGLTLSSGALTFADGSSLNTATVANQATYKATQAGTAASPAHGYTGAANGAGLYFDANGNDLFSVNGYKSLYSTAASGAAGGANGWAITSTLGAGSALFALFGAASTTVPVFQVDGAGVTTSAAHTATGTMTAPAFTINASGGKLTFGDGTSMTTAATGSGGTGTPGTQMRYGTGAPTTTNPATQNDGDSYIQTDQSMLWGPRANGTWPATPISLIGPTGPTGLSTFTTQSAGLGTTWAVTATTSTTAVNAVVPGTTITHQFTPAFTTAFMGLVYTNNNASVAATATLFDQTASATIWSGTLAANTAGNLGQFATTAYPMVGNHTYVWQITTASSVTSAITAQPVYLYPAASASYNVSSLPTTGNVNTTFSGTAVGCNVLGTSLGSTWKFSKASNIYALTVSNTSTAALSLILQNATGTVLNTWTIPASSSGNTFGPYGIGTYAMAANTQYYYTVKGSGTGSIVVDTQVLFAVP